MSTKLTFLKCKQMRWYSTKQKMKIIASIDELLTNSEMKHRNHPGISKPKQVQQPKWLVQAVCTILRDETITPKAICASGKILSAHLNQRKPPQEKEDIKLKFLQVRDKFQINNTKEINNNELLENPEIRNYWKSIVYNWNPIEYNKYTSLAYLVSRSIPEYSVLYKIFNEIVENDANFKPRTLFDYGSGVGTVMWASSQFWVNSIKEYYSVDISKNMNEISEYLIKRAEPQIKSNYIFYRQYFPVSPIPTYDIVVSAYSLFELPSQKSRLEVISKLWEKTEQYMVIVEQGTRAGFRLVNEARTFILKYGQKVRSAHIFSPCPHDLTCPRYEIDNEACNFSIHYLALPIGQKANYKHECYSYVVIKKGSRPEDSCKWPRIIKPVLKRSRHVVCRMCTASGKLEEQIFTTWKNGKNTYRCSRSSEWGDRLPFENVNSEEPENPE